MEKNKDAIRYETVTFDEVYEKGLKVMDLTAFTLCNENKVPIIVFDMNNPEISYVCSRRICRYSC